MKKYNPETQRWFTILYLSDLGLSFNDDVVTGDGMNLLAKKRLAMDKISELCPQLKEDANRYGFTLSIDSLISQKKDGERDHLVKTALVTPLK